MLGTSLLINPGESKGKVVEAAGGVGMILVDKTDKDVAIPFVIPATIVGKKKGNMILTYIKHARKAMARIFSVKTVLGSQPAPQITAFSSKGPNSLTPEILKIHSFCDHVRQLYYKFRSRGILAYSAVSSSTVNSDQQFPNGLQSKVPMFLGGLSVFVCFVAAFISLALALLIVPRQVMPWTGMLLMYEWTFMIFLLLFGSYLHLIYQWGKMKAYQVGSVSSRLESVDYDSGKGLQRQVSSCDIATCYYGLGMAFLAIAARSLPCFLGITALFLRLGLMFALYLS